MSVDRREFVALGVGALALAGLPRARRRGPGLVRRQIPVMGTLAEVAVRHHDGAWAQRAIDAAMAELRRVDDEMTRFRPYSDVGRVNAAAGTGAVAVSAATAEVARAALTWAERTGGRFDPCLGRSAEMWDLAVSGSLPPAGMVHRLAERELWRSLEVGAAGTAPELRLHEPDAALDFGGIAKGYAVDQAARALRDHGVFHALVNAGGDLMAMGVDDGGEPWRVGVRSPERPDEIVDVLRVSDRAVATSGDYLRFFERGGRRYHHLLDPATGEPRRTAMSSLTVDAPSCMDADAAATALFGSTDGARAWLPAEIRIVHHVSRVG